MMPLPRRRQWVLQSCLKAGRRRQTNRHCGDAGREGEWKSGLGRERERVAAAAAGWSPQRKASQPASQPSVRPSDSERERKGKSGDQGQGCEPSGWARADGASTEESAAMAPPPTLRQGGREGGAAVTLSGRQ